MGDLTQLGHYVIKGLLRHGLSADSYFAENATMRSQKVLLRVLHPETAGDPAFVRAFMEEARIAARLEHNCIASVLDLKDEGDRIYAVLEFIEGLELGELLERFGPPPPEVAVAIMRDVCSALEHAHGKSILHRRLRPRQIKITPEGGVKVLGFGLRERESFLQSSVMPDAMREEMYRPPEQVREEPQDVRGDLYTLAVIIYELLTGTLPFDTLPGLAGQGPLRKPPSIYEKNPLVPAGFGKLLERCLAERREERPADAGEVRRALDDLLDEYRVMHTSDLLQMYLGNPPDYTAQARKRSLEAMLRDAERLSKGGDAERRAAIEELDRLLAADPSHKQAASLARKLKPGSTASIVPPAPAAPQPAYDPDKTMLDIPGVTPPARPAAAAPPPPPPPPVKKAPPSSTRQAEEVSEVTATVVGAPRPSAPPPPPPARSTPRAAAPNEHAARAKSMGPLVLAAGAVVVLIAVALTLFVWHPWKPRTTSVDDFAAMNADSTLRLDVETVPAGAQVMLPGTGETRVSPTWFERLTPGATRVRVMLAGYQTKDTTVELVAGQQGALRLELVPAAAAGCTLFVVTKPRADQVLVDGILATPVDTLTWYASVEPGTHSVEVMAIGYDTFKNLRAAKVAEGANARVKVTLRPTAALGEAPVAGTPGAPAVTPGGSAPPATGGSGKPWDVPGGTKVTIECVPEAELIVDGARYPSLVSRADLSMAPGGHRFRFVHPDYVEAVHEKNVKAGKAAKIRQDFRIGSGILSVSAQSTGLQVFVRGKFRGYTPLVVREVETGRCQVELRDKAGKNVLGTKEVIVSNSSVPVDVRF